MLLELGGPAAHKVALDTLERVVRVGELPLFVLLRYVGVARRRFGAELALVLVQVVLDKVLVDLVHHVEFDVANGADKQLLVVCCRHVRGGGGGSVFFARV